MSHSKACCTVPPVIAEGYQEKGVYRDINGLKTYVTGPQDASKAIVIIYDIFGFFPQTIQGADILAHGDAQNKYRVFIPDLFEGNPCPIEWYPPDTPEKKKQLGAFFGQWNPVQTAPLVAEWAKGASEEFTGLTWGLHGFCWGGKVAGIIAGSVDPLFSVASTSHPAMVDPADAKAVKLPFCMLASKDEDAEAVAAFEAALTVPKHVETFGDQIHGWMAARSDLKDERVKEEYVRGYQTLLSFYGQHL